MARDALEDNQSCNVLDLLCEVVGFVLKPLLFCMRTMLMMVVTWIELLRGVICFQLNALWMALMWTSAFLSLPAQALAALQREKMLEERVLELQAELDNMLWQLPKLENRLLMAIRERKVAEGLFAELKKEHELATRKLKLLESEVPKIWCQKSGASVLSLFVGMIMWEAKDPCMPLVVALFSVVGISLFGVVQFISTIKNKPAIDAVALLSLNCFVLGILTFPTLPKVAELLSPVFAHAGAAMAMWLVRLLV